MSFPSLNYNFLYTFFLEGYRWVMDFKAASREVLIAQFGEYFDDALMQTVQSGSRHTASGPVSRRDVGARHILAPVGVMTTDAPSLYSVCCRTPLSLVGKQYVTFTTSSCAGKLHALQFGG